jgi:hypothetical protein
MFELQADVDPALTFTLSVEAGLSGLHTGWTQGPYRANEQGVVTARLIPPSEAFLHEVALDYLTVLRVRLTGTGEDGSVLIIRAPNAFLAWPNGQQAGPVVWDRATAAVEAPNGVVSETVRTSLGELPEGAWVQPSMSHPTRNSE